MADLNVLARKFPANLVKKNPKGFDYIGIEHYISRFNEVFGPNWDFRIKETRVQVVNPATDGIGVQRRTGAVTGFLCTVTAEITIKLPSEGEGEASWDTDWHTRSGVGADFDTDPDKALKTAQAEAFKKAAQQFGVGLYLWNEEDRADVAQAKAADAGDLAALKSQVYKLALRLTGKDKLSASEVAAVFSKDLAEMQQEDELRDILVQHSVLV